MMRFLSRMTVLLALICTSCKKNRFYPVSGKVTCRGLPASGASVFFYRKSADPASDPVILGIVREDGTFELVSGTRKGAPPGYYDVLVEWKKIKPQGRHQRDPDVFNGRYSDRSHPLLNAKIESKATTLPAFELAD